MKLGIMSDTHGHLDLMRQVALKMINDHKVEAIIHLGDDSTDAEQLASLSVDVHWVPGIFEPRYKDPSIPNRVIKEFEDVPFLLTHTPAVDPHDIEGDINPADAIHDGDVKVMLHGHTHVYRIVEEKGVFIINPGHLKPNDEKGREPTYAVLDVLNSKLHVKICGINGNAIEEKTFFLEG